MTVEEYDGSEINWYVSGNNNTGSDTGTETSSDDESSDAKTETDAE